MTHISGIVPPMTTPFDDNEDVDDGALRADF
jgi:dihydrodipicolinate synthase/N-acetylneuraminate lyase